MTVANLDHLLAPRSLALLGASGRPGSLGAVVLARLEHAGFHGDIGLVNPHYTAVGDRPCVPRVEDLPFVPDLGVIVTPAATVPALVGALAQVGAKAAVVVSAGVTPALRKEMLAAAHGSGMRILGPNCLGLQVPAVGLDASFAHLTARRGNLALLSQSGAIVTAMLDWAEARGVGFSTVASMGDMADVDVGDLLDHLAGDRATRAILMYLEGVTHAQKFMSAARSAARVKPVIVIKAGRSAHASRAAASHTGALAGADDVYEAAFARAGVLRVDDLQELFDAAEALARHRPLAGDRLAILTNGGGAGVLAVDVLAHTTGRLAEPTEATLESLDAALPPAWSRGNPFDILGDAGPARYEAALATLLAAPEVDAVLVMNCPTGLASSAEAAEAVVSTLAQRRGPGAKPVLASWLGGTAAAAAAKVLEEAGVAAYGTPGQGVRAFDQLVRYRKAQRQLMRAPSSLPEDTDPDRAAAAAIFEAVLAEGRDTLTEVEANDVLAAYGIPIVPTRVAANPEEAAAVAAEILAAAEGDPPLLAVKILSPDISHKADVGGVRLNLIGPQEVAAATRSMLERVAVRRPEARLTGVVVQPMVRRPDAHELLLGIGDDETFGPVMLFGEGGTSVEVVADMALALPPLDLLLAGDLMAQTRVSRLLEGYRDKPAADTTAIAVTLCRLSQLAADLPQVRELDINPLLADASGVVALDARIRIAPAAAVAPGGNPRFAIRPYPAAWEAMATLPDGTPIRIRPIRPEDEALYPAFLSRVTQEDFKQRFFGTADISHTQIARFTQIDYARAVAFLALDMGGEIVGVSRFVTDPDYKIAEFAILVRSDLADRGIGRALMSQLIEYARTEGIAEIYGDILASNTRMLHFVRQLGFSLKTHPDDITLRSARFDLSRLPQRG